MKLEQFPDCFHLESSDPNKPPQGFACYATAEESLEQWVSTITDILKTQHDFLKAIQSPIAYQKELTKEA